MHCFSEHLIVTIALTESENAIQDARSLQPGKSWAICHSPFLNKWHHALHVWLWAHMALSVLYEEDLGEWTLSWKSETKRINFCLVIKCSVRFIKKCAWIWCWRWHCEPREFRVEEDTGHGQVKFYHPTQWHQDLNNPLTCTCPSSLKSWDRTCHHMRCSE